MATVAASGGLDSTVLMYMLAEEQRLTQAVLLNFGQPSFAVQRTMVQYHLQQLARRGHHVHLEVLECVFPEAYREGRPFEKGAHAPRRPARSWPDALQRFFGRQDSAFSTDNFALVPARNSFIALFAAAAAAHYEEPPEIVLGFQFEPEQWDKMDMITGDLTPKYWTVVGLLLEMALDVPVALELPFLDRRWGKKQIIREAQRLDIDIKRTYSCEFGQTACGRCAQCLLRADRLAQAGEW